MTLLTTKRCCYSWCRPLFFPGIQVPERRERARADDRPEHVSSSFSRAFCVRRIVSSFICVVFFSKRLGVVFVIRARIVECPMRETEKKECRECLFDENAYIYHVCLFFSLFFSSCSRIFFSFFFIVVVQFFRRRRRRQLIIRLKKFTLWFCVLLLLSSSSSALHNNSIFVVGVVACL